MPHYVDIGVVRIQRYLSRTPTLRGRRGASFALVAATDLSDGDAALAGRARLNPEAGQVDGVLSLVLDDPGQRDPVVRDVLAHLRTRLPGAEIQVAWGDGDSYLQAYTHQIRPMIERGNALVDLPAGAEFPAVALCGICRVDPAVDSVDLGADDGVRDACADCVMRHSREIRWQGRTAEERLAKRVGAADTPGGFNDLAELGDRASGRSHLATLHADGNRVGSFFAELATAGRVDRAEVVARLAACTFDALAAATCAVRRPSDPFLCVVPHLVGGDDVLVSLPADRAWRFVVEFLDDFGARAARLVRDLNIAGLEPPTMSAGLVFARHDFPFALAAEEAEQGLRQAKGVGAGRQPWVRFLDLTSEGPGGGGHPVSLAALKAYRMELNRLAALPRSSRERLGEALRAGRFVAAQTLAARLGRAEVVEPFLKERDDLVIDLDQALRIARWWR